MVFANIEYLFLLLLLIPYIVWYIMKRRNNEATLQISDARVYAHTPKSYKNYLLHAPFVLRIISLVLLILVLARPQTTDSWQNSEIEGIDIMMAVDVSTSMLAEDLKPNRLEAAKDVAAQFINGRPNDNIGITLFAGESFTHRAARSVIFMWMMRLRNAAAAAIRAVWSSSLPRRESQGWEERSWKKATRLPSCAVRRCQRSWSLIR